MFRPGILVHAAHEAAPREHLMKMGCHRRPVLLALGEEYTFLRDLQPFVFRRLLCALPERLMMIHCRALLVSFAALLVSMCPPAQLEAAQAFSARLEQRITIEIRQQHAFHARLLGSMLLLAPSVPVELSRALQGRLMVILAAIRLV
jgi:hypothetical protein